jgi:fucose 4-O-acetylase-like acetyltransferase
MVGKAVLLFSLGLITWGIGIGIWLLYNFILQVEIPYPSLADAAFIISWPLWGAGAIYLSRATGAQYGLRKRDGKAILLIVPIIIIALSYYFLVVLARGGTFELAEDGLTIFFDLAYPIGDVIILTLATLIYGLSYRYFGGAYRSAIYLILGAFVLNYFADFTFSYTTATETYYNGSLADVLFATTMFIFSLGIALLDPHVVRGKSPTATSNGQFEE